LPLPVFFKELVDFHLPSRSFSTPLELCSSFKDKVSSLRSTKHQFALHSIRVLNHHEPRNQSRFPFANDAGARADA
jgi:hypothetical protein